MRELSNYFTTKMIYACPECFSHYIIDANRYEAFLYYTRFGMEDGEWMFLDETFWDEALNWIADNRGNYSSLSIRELENDCIRRCNIVLQGNCFQENANEALQKEMRYRGIPRYSLCRKEDIKELFWNDYCNFETLRSFNSSEILANATYPDFLYTVAFCIHLDELGFHYPRVMQQNQIMQLFQSYCCNLLDHFTHRECYSKTKEGNRQYRLAKRIYQEMKKERKEDLYGE